MKKGLIVILAAALAVGLGLGGLSLTNNAKSTREFIADGYIIDPSDEETITTNVDAQYYFAQGDKYKERYGDHIIFNDTSTGDKESLDTNHFVHYNDGSLGAFTKGVIMDISDMSTEESYGYYSLTKNTVLIKSGNSYEMTSRGESMALSEFVWKISDNDYMLVSPSITLDVGPEEVTFSDYAQITYVDSGIVRISHQTGSYQTVAADSELVTEQGAELNLVGKSFMVDGEPIFSLDDMAIDDDSYIDVDENVQDTPTIPTFNVINGKDGASGSDGEQGTEGEQGEDGDEGEEGAEGTAGGEGTMGSEGAMGEDGTEGTMGTQGFDGKEGAAGKDAETASSASPIDAVELNSRPEVKMETIDGDTSAASFDISATSAKFSLKMTEANDRPTIAQTKTKITLYDRETMEVVKVIDSTNNSDIISALESETSSATMTFNDLEQDTEYMLVVTGQYAPDPKNPGNYVETTFYRKIFKTEGTGISISKNIVTDSTISAKVDVNGNVNKFAVRYFYYDSAGTAKNLAKFTESAAAGTGIENRGYTHEVNNTEISSRPEGSLDAIASNTTYYAYLENVVGGTNYNEQILSPISGGELPTIDVLRDYLEDGRAVELKTLKKTPYATDGSHEPIIEMQPTLTANNNNSSMILSLPGVTDPDRGIQKYRYELYKYSDLFDTSGNPVTNLSDIRPSFTEERDSLEQVSFKLPSGDSNVYVGKIVAIFDDNEKTRELSTQMSASAGITGSTENLIAELKSLTTGYNQITGQIYIKDTENIVRQYATGDHPLILTLSSPYDDLIEVRYQKDRDGDYNTATNVWTIPFTVSGLRSSTAYSISLIGAEDTNRLNGIEASEQATRLTGARVTTDVAPDLSVVAAPAPAAAASKLFATRVMFTSRSVAAEASSTEQTTEDSKVKEDLKSVTYLKFRLIRTSDSLTIAEKTIVDAGASTYGSAYSSAFTARANVVTNSDGTLSLSSTATAEGHEYLITPEFFSDSLENDSRLTAGGEFQIVLVEAGDFRVGPGETIGAEPDYANCNKALIVPGEDRITFTVSARHLQADHAYNEVTVDPITNGDGREENLSSNTVIGLRFRANYANKDVKDIHYYIYKITSNQTTTVLNENELTSDNTELAPGNDVKSELVLHGYKEIGSGLQYTQDTVELYFNGTESPSGYVWTDSYDALVSSLPKADQTILKRGERYIIRYEVKVVQDMHDSLECPGKNSRPSQYRDIYPYCAYPAKDSSDNPIPVPWYRSQVIELQRELPTIERYPYSSEGSSETWMYRFVDPDNALGATNDITGKVVSGDTVEAVEAITAGTGTSVSFNDISNTFKTYSIEVNPNKYYRVDIPYKALASDATDSYISSAVVKFVRCEQPSTSDKNKLRLEGEEWTDKYIDADKSAGSTKLKAILNEGNYRYRITLQGTDIGKLAAVRVTLTYGGNTLVYDPVYLDTVGSDGSYAYAHIDASALKNIPKNTSVTVSVKGYYAESNGFGAVSDYVAQSSYANDSFGTSPVYAFRTYSASGSTEYKRLDRLDNNAAAGVPYPGPAPMNYSLFVPVRLDIENKVVTQKYTYLPMAVTTVGGGTQASSFVDYSLNVNFNQTGMMSGTDYVNVQKLALTDDIQYERSEDATFTVGDIMPAIEENLKSPGSTSATVRMELKGSLNTDSAKVYPMVLKLKSGTTSVYEYINVNAEYEDIDGDQVNDIQFYDAVMDGVHNATYDNTTSIMNTLYGLTASPAKKPLEVQTINGIKYVTLRLRKLEQGSEYHVRFYTYNNGQITFLYDSDKNEVGREYQVVTKDQIELFGELARYNYNSYGDKEAVFNYRIGGEEGDYTIITYEVFEGTSVSGNVVVSEKTTTPKGGSSYWYYSSVMGENEPFVIKRNKATGPLVTGKQYTVRLRIYDAQDKGINASVSDLQGKMRGETVFTIPAVPSLSVPTINIRDAYYANGKIQLNLSITDNMRSVIDDKFKVTITDDSDPGWSKEVTLERTSGSSVLRDTISLDGHVGSGYKVDVVADYDTDNDGVKDGQATASSSIAGEEKPSSDIGYSVSTSAINVTLSNVKNFDNVTSIYVTVYDADDSNPFNGSVDVLGNGTYSIPCSGLTAGKQYSISLQYRTPTRAYNTDAYLVTVN